MDFESRPGPSGSDTSEQLSALELENFRLNQRIEELVQERTQVLARAKRDWESTFDAIRSPIATLSADGVIVRANLAFAQAVGRDVRELNGTRCDQLLCAGGTGCSSCPVHASTSHEKRSVMVRLRDRRAMAMEVSRHADGDLMVVCLRDVSDDQTRLTDVVQLEKMVALGQLAGGIAHEINNPLASILAFSQIMKGEPNRTADDAEAIALIEQSALRCKNIVDTMLRFARRSTDRELVDPLHCVQETLALFRIVLKSFPRLEVQVALPPGLPKLQANANQLQQVLLNLLQNAAQAFPDGRGKVTISAAVEGSEVLIRIADDGPGIAPENLERIFEPGFTTKPPGSGTGLGLPIVERLLQAHGGRISVRSELGHGAEFTVVLPAAPAEVEQ